MLYMVRKANTTLTDIQRKRKAGPEMGPKWVFLNGEFLSKGFQSGFADYYMEGDLVDMVSRMSGMPTSTIMLKLQEDHQTWQKEIGSK